MTHRKCCHAAADGPESPAGAGAPALEPEPELEPVVAFREVSLPFTASDGEFGTKDGFVLYAIIPSPLYILDAPSISMGHPSGILYTELNLHPDTSTARGSSQRISASRM